MSTYGAPLLSLEDAARPAAETTTSKGLTVYVDLNNKTYDIQRSIDESYDNTLKKRVVFQTVLSKWNYLVKRSEFLPSYSFRITKFFITFANVRFNTIIQENIWHQNHRLSFIMELTP